MSQRLDTEVILRPLVTEKSLARAERHNTYTFQVRPSANKIEIRRAVERLFDVRVVGVRTQLYAGKRRRLGRSVGSTSAWKKAMVQVQEGQTIDFY